MVDENTNDSKLSERIYRNVSSTDLSLSYKYSLGKATSNGLWEFGITIIWKFVVLFYYEKLYQLYLLGKLNKCFIDSLNARNRDCHNCFSFNSLEDNQLFEKMDFIWRNIDGNYKNIFRKLLDERNSLSHVNEYPYSEIKFKAYAEDALNLLEYLQKLHLQLNLENIYQNILHIGEFEYLSQVEIKKLLDMKGASEEVLIFLTSLIPTGLIDDTAISIIKREAINQFVSAGSFASAQVKANKLIKLLFPYFDRDNFQHLLKDLTNKPNRQIIVAGGLDNLFVAMYSESFNNHPELNEMWLAFVGVVSKMGASEYFEKLIEATN